MATRPHLDLNTADAHQLALIFGIDTMRAELIVKYRRDHGPIRSWEEVLDIPGVGEALSDRAVLYAALGEPAEGEDLLATEAFEGEDEEAARERGKKELDALAAIARLDMEAAAAHQVAAGLADEETIRRMLESFCDDHLRHVDELRVLARARHASLAGPTIEPGHSVLAALVTSAGALDSGAALDALIENEHLTQATYDNAVLLVSDPAAVEVVERSREDERRHIEALLAVAHRGDRRWHEGLDE